MNFGKWIVVAFVLFALFIGTLVTVCIRQKVNLVSKDYYNEELAYQDQIKRISNTHALTNKPLITNSGTGQFEISFSQPVDKGEFKLFCPSDPDMDRNFEMKLLDNKQILDLHSVKPGMYRMKIYWSANNKDYFLEEVIYI